MELIKYLINTSFITVAIIFIGKLAVGKIFDGLVETYKYKLNTELEEFKTKQQTVLEQFKAKQQKVLEEYKITYSKLHEERAKVITDLYKKIVRIESKIENFVQWNNLLRIDMTVTPHKKFDELDLYEIGEYKKSMENLSKEMFYEFFDFVHENDIFFKEDLVEALIKLCKLLSTMRILADLSKDTFEKGEFEHTVKKNNESYNNLIEILRNIKNIKKELQKEFRTLLGVN